MVTIRVFDDQKKRIIRTLRVPLSNIDQMLQTMLDGNHKFKIEVR